MMGVGAFCLSVLILSSPTSPSTPPLPSAVSLHSPLFTMWNIGTTFLGEPAKPILSRSKVHSVRDPAFF